jgi:hypothetical protein
MAPDLFKAFCEEFHRELNRMRNQETAEFEAKKLSFTASSTASVGLSM